MKIRILIITILMLLCLCPTAMASETEGIDVDLSELEELSDKLQQEYEYIPDISIKGFIDTYKKTGSLGEVFKQIIKGSAGYLSKEILESSRLLVELLFLGLISAVLKNIQNAFSKESVSNIGYYACFLVMVVIIIKSLKVAIGLGQETIGSMIEFTNALMPCLIVLVAAVGGFTSAATLDPVVIAAGKIISNVIADFVLPLTLLVVILQIVNSLSDGIKVSNLAKLLSDISKWCIGITVTVFVAIVSIRSSISATLDQVTAKTAKFAVDTFIPVVGKALSDAVATVAGYSLVLKDALGIIGLIFLITICVFPLLKIIVIALIYKLVGAVMQPVVDDKITLCLNSVGNSLTMVFASVLSVAVMFFIIIAIVISTGRLLTAVG
jgi:stage III sporulation protein AE